MVGMHVLVIIWDLEYLAFHTFQSSAPEFTVGLIHSLEEEEKH